jgi:hypothetical protein
MQSSPASRYVLTTRSVSKETAASFGKDPQNGISKLIPGTRGKAMKQFNSSVLVTEQTTNVICDVGGTL